MLTAAAIALLAAATSQGHSIKYRLSEGEIGYRFRGAVSKTYIGGRTAPEVRTADISGTYILQTELTGSEWFVVGSVKSIAATAESRQLQPSDLAKLKGGKWRVSLNAPSPAYTWDGKPAVPFSLSAPLWPIAWMPIVAESGLRIEDEISIPFVLPLQSLLEDDPVGDLPLNLRFVFDGPQYGAIRTFRFKHATDVNVDVPVKHPEDPGLTLRGRVKILGSLDVSREDGRLETSATLVSIELRLEGDKYPFGFAVCRAEVTSAFERMR